jgi:formylglycine-generating enzyme required for sulfatase activity
MNIFTKIEIVGILIALLSGAVWIGALTTQISVLERDYEDMKEENKNILDEIQDIKQQIMNPAAVIKVYETQLHNIKTKIAEVQQTVDSFKITELQTQITGVEGKLNQLNQTLPNLKIKLGDVSQQALSLQKDYDAIKQQKQNTINEIQNVKPQISAVESQLGNIETKIAEVQQTVDRLQIAKLETQVSGVEGKLNQLNQTLPNLKIKLGDVSQQALSLQKDYDAIKQQKQNTINEIQKVKPHISALDSQLLNVETKIAEAKQTVDRLQIAELQTQVSNVKGKLNQLNYSLSNLKIQMTESSQQALSSIKSQTEQTVSEVKQEIKTIQQNNIKEEVKTIAPGGVIRDRLKIGGFGPEMVMIPAGSFNMDGNNVSVKQFAMGKYEVTVGEYMKFVKATNTHAPEWLEEGSSYNIKTGSDNYYKKLGSALTNENHPIVGVSWYDAVAYTKWLSQQTGKTYRLPTEAEWEYAARAGTTTKYWWGNDIGKNKANCSGNLCGDNFKYTSPVGSFSANPFGLYDTSGNVSEWSCSEYESKYNGKEKVCINVNTNKYRVLRGGSWLSNPTNLRTASRPWNAPDLRFVNDGFRLVVLRAAWTN